jgi:hypothetical protein
VPVKKIVSELEATKSRAARNMEIAQAIRDQISTQRADEQRRRIDASELCVELWCLRTARLTRSRVASSGESAASRTLRSRRWATSSADIAISTVCGVPFDIVDAPRALEPAHLDEDDVHHAVARTQPLAAHHRGELLLLSL